MEEKRLRTRLARERKARAEAEEIAERTLRDLYHRQRDLELLETVAVASNTAQAVDEAMQVAIDRVCEHTGWPVGHVYVPRGDGTSVELVPTRIWHLDDPQRFETLREVTNGMTFPSGVGLPGRILESGLPAWIVDVNKDPNFPRAKPATDIGVTAAFGFPALAGDEVVAVLEFFSPATAEPDERLLELLRHVGSQLGLVLGRTRARKELTRHSQRGDEEVARLSRQNELILNSAAEGICGLDASGRVSFANPAAARMLGWQTGELIGKTMHDAAHGADPADGGHADSDCPIHLSLRDGATRTIDDDAFRRGNGTSFPVEWTSTPIVERGDLRGAVVTFRDITERKRFESELQYLADHDPLTGLFNRHRFEEELTRQLAHSDRYGDGGALLILDLDNFKYVNDAFGHHAGDELIRSIAGLLSRRLRAADVVSRLGGDEFGILLSEVDASEARSVATDLVDLVRGHTLTVGDQAVRVTASIGAALLGSRPELTPEQLIIEADVAMYQAKEAGRDRSNLYRSDTSPKTPDHLGLVWTDRIRTALEGNLLVVHCQPILHLLNGNGNRARYELLVRMTGEDGTLVPPRAFLPAAERFDLVQDIDAWMVSQAVGLIDAESRAGRSVTLEVNVSEPSIGDPGFLANVERALEQAAIHRASLVLEVTETAAIANLDEARRFATRIKELGCEFALDHFGAGFRSFYYLEHLPVDYLKIDGEFVRGLPRSRIDRRMVKAMVEIARGLELRTIAECVETPEALEQLEEYGVDFAQGYHLGRPRPTAGEIAAPETPKD